MADEIKGSQTPPVDESVQPKQEQSDVDRSKVKYVYTELVDMLEVINQGYAEFNTNNATGYRTLRQFLDDSQKRANSFTPSNATQGKEDWQANVFTRTTRNKVKALLAGIAKNPPSVSMTAVNEANQTSSIRAEMMKTCVDASYVEGDNNPKMEMFFDGWDCTVNGTVIKYDGYLKVKNKVRYVKSYDNTTGEMEIEEREEYTEDQAIEVQIPLLNFLVKSAYIRDVQKQPAVAWVEVKSKEEAEYEWGDFPNWKKVKNAGQLVAAELQTAFFGEHWMSRVGVEQYEIVRYYNKIKDIYRVVINGVLILDAPLLWGQKRKKYPFAKTILEPFANSMFFWGNSLPNILMAEQDVENALINSFTDITYREVTTPLLIGEVNKDDFDLEDDQVDSDTRIYVKDVTQVTPMPVKGITAGGFNMLKQIQSGMEKDSTDSVQGGKAGTGSTAREIVIANERADEIKGLFFSMMEDLWLQKYRLRPLNIMMNYSTPRLIEEFQGDEKVVKEMYKVFRLPEQELSDGSTGVREVQVVKDKNQLARPFELDTMETKRRMEGNPTEISQITSTYFDDWEYVAKIQSDSMYQKSKSLKMSMNQEKITGAAKLFPEIFMANKNEFFKMYMETYGDDASKFELPPPMQAAVPGMEAVANSGMPPAGAPPAA